MLLMCAVETARQSHGPLFNGCGLGCQVLHDTAHDLLHLSSSMHGMKLTCLTQ